MKTLLIFSLFFSAYAVHAQDSLKPVKKIRVNDVCAQLSIANELNMLTNIDEFRKMFPGSELMKADLSLYTHETRPSSTLNTGLVFFAGTSFKFANKTKTAYRKNVRLRAGISFNSFELYAQYRKVTIKPFDSIYPSIAIDSINQRDYSLGYNGKQIRADISFLWSSNQEKRRLSVYTGLGASGGISLLSTGFVSYNVYRDLQFRDKEPMNAYNARTTETTFETFKGVSSYGFSAYVPLGADLRLGKTRNFWKRAHIYYELKPMCSLLIIPGTKTFSNFGIQHGWGLRFTV